MDGWINQLKMINALKFLIKSYLAHNETMSFLATVAISSYIVCYKSDGAERNSSLLHPLFSS